MNTTGTVIKDDRGLSRQAGLTLVELMISLLIGLLLMAGAIQVFISSKGTYDAQQEAARLQENVRFAHRFLTRDLRGVGFLGCGSNAEFTDLFDASAPFEFGPEAMIRGWSWADDGNGPLALANLNAIDPAQNAASYNGPSAPPGGFDARRGSDILQVWVVEGSARVDAGPGGGGVSEVVSIRDARGLSEAGVLFITDCVDGYFTPYCDYTAGNNQLAINSSCSHGASSMLGSLTFPADAIGLTSHVYYIGENAIGRPSLYRRTLNVSDGSWGNALELVEGVEAMRVEYGVAGGSSGRVNSYERAVDVLDWEQVVSAQFALLMVGEGRYPGSSGAEEYELFEHTFAAAAGDERLRRVTRTTVTLRNRTD